MPSLKEPEMDTDEIDNYRLISNLSFLSQMIEKIVARQMFFHLEASELLL